MSRRDRERSAQEAASEAGRILQSQRQQPESSPEPSPEPSEPREAVVSEPLTRRNANRDAAMAEIEARDLREKGIIEASPKPAEQAPEPARPTADEILAANTPQSEAPTPAPVAEPEAPKMVRVKVDGQEFDVSEAEIEESGGVKPYQIDRAAKNRLQKANETLAQAQRTQAQIAAWVQSQQAPKAPEQTPDQFMQSKVDVIRFGTPEESAAALREVMDRNTQRIDPTAITNAAVSKMQQNMALESFQHEFSDVVSNPLLLKLGITLESERLAQMQGQAPNWPTFYRSLGNELRSLTGRPSQSSQAVKTDSTSPVDKETRKSSIVNLPTAAARAALPEADKPETREDTLRNMRKARGLPTG